MSAAQEAIERLDKLLYWSKVLLRVSSVVALGLVSWGSYSVVLWIGMPVVVAIAYPIVIDLAMLYITPFAVNAMLPKDAEWPIRPRAARIRAFVWVVVGAFNELHSVMVVQHSLTVPTEGVMRWMAYAVASVIGVGPVVFYGYAYAIEATVSAWILDRQSNIAIEAEVKQEAKEEAKEAREERREIRQERIAQAVVQPASRAPAEPRGSGKVGRARGPRTEEQLALLATLPGEHDQEKVQHYIIEQYTSGNPLSASKIHAATGYDRSTVGKMIAELEGEGKLRPQLKVANQ
jgi:membrane glycosyltransferase